MEFMSGYYRQKGDSGAVLLQQYVCRGVPVCLGCICGGESREAGMAGGWFTGQLLEEFRGFRMTKAVGNPEKFMRRMERKLYKCRESCEDFPDFQTAGILCTGESFLLFFGGKVNVVLCNTGFGRPAVHEMKGEESERGPWMQLQRGSMEAGIGILLASESFYRNILQEEMQSCLSVKEIHDSRQTQKRIQELGRAAERRGGRGMAALLLEVR